MEKILTNEEKAVGISLQVRDLCVEKGVTRDNAETASLLAQQAVLKMAEWKDIQFKEEKKKWLDKAYMWIENKYIKNSGGYYSMYRKENIIKSFKKAMEEEI